MNTELWRLIRLHLADLWQRRWSVLLLAWAMCLVGWAVVATMPNRYEAEARIFVDTESIIGPLMDDLAITPNIDRRIRIMRQTLLSRPNIEELMRMTDLDLVYADPVEREAAVRGLADDISIEAVGSNLFEIAYESTEPERAYRVVDSVIELFVEQNVGVTQRDVNTAQEFLARRIQQYEQKLREAELAVAEFKRENAEELSGVSRAQSQLENARGQMRALRSQIESANWQRDQLRLQLAATPETLTAEQGGAATPEQQRVLALRQQLNALLLTYTDRHPDVQATRDQLAQAEQAAARAGPSVARSANPVHQGLQDELRKNELTVANLERQMSLLEQDIERLSVLVSQTPQVQADLTRLTRDYNVTLNQYQELTQRREVANLAERLDAETDNIEFRIVDPPFVPNQPSGPPHGLLMAGVLVAALGGSLGLAWLRAQVGGLVRSTDQLENLLGLPVLGAVSRTRTGASRRLAELERVSFLGATLALLLVFGVMFYLFQLAPTKPNIEGLTGDLRAQLDQAP